LVFDFDEDNQKNRGFLDTQKITSSFNPHESKSFTQLQSGTVLVNRYQIQDVIGVGGMGSVYRARDNHFPNVVKYVAVKEMIINAPDPLVRETIVINFEREANILVTLNHPSIPQIYDYFSKDERSYLVMEYIAGKDLEAILAENDAPLPEEKVMAWTIELCDVLSFLHGHQPEPIIFRDIKPSNIMIDQYGKVKLVDFGIAKTFRSGQKGTMIGTEGYSPPEQYRGEATPVADIYALGATIHHLLTNKDPRVEAPFSFNERMIRSINPLISTELEVVIYTALQYDPEDRFKTTEDLKQALVLAARKTGMLSKLNVSKVSKEQSIKPIWTFKCEDDIRGSVLYENGSVYCGSYDNNLYSVNASDGSFNWKYPTGGGVITRPTYHDGLILIGSEDASLHAISSRTGKRTWFFKADGPIRSSANIAEGHAFFGADDGYLYAVNLLSNRLTWRVEGGAPIRTTPFVSKDFVYAGTEMGDFFCVDFRGQVKWRFKAKRAITSSPLVSDGIVYFASLDAQFYALDSKSGWVVWRFRMEKGSISSPCKKDNNVIFGSADGFIYCLDSGNAKEIWSFKTDHQVSGSPIIYKDGVYCGTADGTMYCLDINKGHLRWKYKTGGPITGTPTVVNDVIYFGSSDHMIYALYA
jgi:serine/threonine protein kinase